MKKLIFILLAVMGLSVFGQTDKYGNYFNISRMVPPPKGNGYTDDRAIILKALQTYKSIFIPYTEKGYAISGTLVVPAGCKLVFDVGAKFVGSGTIRGTGTIIEGQGELFASTLAFSGTFKGDYLSAGWFGAYADYTTVRGLFTQSGQIYISVDTTGNDFAITDDITAASLWAKIDTAVGNLNMSDGNIENVNAISADFVDVDGLFAFSQMRFDIYSNEKDTLDWSTGNLHELTLDDTVDIVFLTPTYPCELVLKILHDSSITDYPISWDPNVEWIGGTEPNWSADTASVDIVRFLYDPTDVKYYQLSVALDVK